MTNAERDLRDLDLVLALPEFAVEQLVDPMTDAEVDAIFDELEESE